MWNKSQIYLYILSPQGDLYCRENPTLPVSDSGKEKAGMGWERDKLREDREVRQTKHVVYKHMEHGRMGVEKVTMGSSGSCDPALL